jgi:hypothetical protein
MPVIELNPIPTYQVTGRVIYQDGSKAPFAKVTLFGSDDIYELTCDENGDFDLTAVYKGTYDLNAGVWGHTYESVTDIHEARDFTIQLIPGYKDNFDIDLGWTVSGDAVKGIWSRSIPNEQLLFETYLCGSDGDSPNDIGGFAYTTGESSSENVQDNEVSGGTTWLISPPMDLTASIDPRISLDYWLCEFPPNQYTGLFLWLTNDVDTTLLDSLNNNEINGSWQSKTYDLELAGPLNQVRFLISASDTTSGQADYILKVHLDKFKLLESGLSNNDPYPAGKYFVIYPNPVSGGTIYLKQTGETTRDITSIRFYDLQARLISANEIQTSQQVVEIDHHLEEGMYFMQWQAADGTTGVEKLSVIGEW